MVAQTQKLINMTYVVKEEIAHFYDREDVNPKIPGTKAVHVSTFTELYDLGVKKVMNIPFRMNEEFQC